MKVVGKKTYIDTNGYLRFKGSNHLVHRWVAEKYVVRRKLHHGEVVHHIDRNKLNNNPSNLKVMFWWEHDRVHSRPPIRNGTILECVSAAFRFLRGY